MFRQTLLENSSPLLPKPCSHGRIHLGGSMKRSYTFQLANINGLYSVFFMPVFAYTTVYLLNLGLNNSQIGILLASANLVAVVAQPLVASLADRRVRTHKTLLLIHILIICLQCAFLLFVPLPIYLHAVIFAANIVLLYSMQPLVNSMAVDLMARGGNINFGIARAASSLYYSVATLLFGSVLVRYGMFMVPGSMLLFGALFFLALYFFRPTLDPPHEYQESEDLQTRFFSRYPIFIPVLIGIVGIYFNYSIFNNYAIHIVRNLGGNSSQLGIALAISAFSEIPAMLSFNYLLRRFGATRLFQFSSVFYGVKMLLVMLSGSIPMLYLAQTTQALSFGIYSTSSVYFVAGMMNPNDRSKGQAFITSAATLGNVLAALLGGVFLDLYSVRFMMIIAITVSAVGAALILGATGVRLRAKLPRGLGR